LVRSTPRRFHPRLSELAIRNGKLLSPMPFHGRSEKSEKLEENLRHFDFSALLKPPQLRVEHEKQLKAVGGKKTESR
jgi:hypothetical protein